MYFKSRSEPTTAMKQHVASPAAGFLSPNPTSSPSPVLVPPQKEKKKTKKTKILAPATAPSPVLLLDFYDDASLSFSSGESQLSPPSPLEIDGDPYEDVLVHEH